MVTNIGQAIGVGAGLFVTAKIAGAVIKEAKKIDEDVSKDTIKTKINSLP